jgi:ribonuclease M5
MSLTKADLYAFGLSGREDSASRRKDLAHALHLPDNLSANALLEAINLLVTEEEFQTAIRSQNP